MILIRSNTSYVTEVEYYKDSHTVEPCVTIGDLNSRLMDAQYEMAAVRHRFSVKDLLDLPESKSAAALVSPPGNTCMSPPQGLPHPRAMPQSHPEGSLDLRQGRLHIPVPGGLAHRDSDVSALQHAYYDPDNPYARWLHNNENIHYGRK